MRGYLHRVGNTTGLLISGAPFQRMVHEIMVSLCVGTDIHMYKGIAENSATASIKRLRQIDLPNFDSGCKLRRCRWHMLQMPVFDQYQLSLWRAIAGRVTIAP